MVDQRLYQLRDDLARIPEITLVYVFGSVASGTANASSDLDIGIYTGHKIEKRQSGMFKLRMIDFFVSRLKIDRIDVVIMDYAPVTLNFEIIKQNCFIFSRDESTRIDFEHGIMSGYLDRRYYDLRHAEQVRRTVMERGLTSK